MKRTLLYLTAALAVGIFAAGCGKSTNHDTDQSAIFSLIGANPDLTGSDVLSASNSTFSKAAVDTVKFWWRQILHRGRLVGMGVRQPADSTHPFPFILVTLTDTLEGTLHILGKNNGDTMTVEVLKPFTEVATRRLLFQKRGANNAFRRGWFLAGVSGIELVSVPTVTANIDSVKIQSASFSKTIVKDSILSIVLRPNTIQFSKGDSVYVTVFTGDATDSVYLHVHARQGFNYVHGRRRLTNNGDGSFSGFWKIPQELPFGRWHFAVDVLKGHVLATNVTSDYDSHQWGIIYRVGVSE